MTARMWAGVAALCLLGALAGAMAWPASYVAPQFDRVSVNR